MKRFLSLYAALGFAFLHVPLLVLIAFSFNASKFTVWEGFSLRWYQSIFHDPQILEATGNSVIIALASTALSTAIGALAAYGMWKRAARGLQGSLYLSLVTPEIVTGISLLAFFQYIFRWLPFRLGLATVVLAHVAFSIVYVTVVISARLHSMDRSLEEAAQDLGASEWAAFRRVTLPLLAPGIAAAALLALIVSFDDYVITSLVAGVDSETLPMVVYAIARRGPNPTINAVSALIVVVFSALIVAAERVRKTQ
jgi:spermidine/putrescine transport system permease protein